jgi:hypothetical protein
MSTTDTNREDLDRLVFLLASEPRDGWEDIFEAARRREVQRLVPLAPHPEGKSKGSKTTKTRTPQHSQSKERE